MRGGTMRPENSSKVWVKTFCERVAVEHALIERHAGEAGGNGLLRDAFGRGVGFEVRKPGVEIARAAGNSGERWLGG
ncbi:hypothetical protein ACVWWR_007428 [Bradyrhizobium sp. LM3.2]